MYSAYFNNICINKKVDGTELSNNSRWRQITLHQLRNHGGWRWVRVVWFWGGGGGKSRSKNWRPWCIDFRAEKWQRTINCLTCLTAVLQRNSYIQFEELSNYSPCLASSIASSVFSPTVNASTGLQLLIVINHRRFLCVHAICPADDVTWRWRDKRYFFYEMWFHHLAFYQH